MSISDDISYLKNHLILLGISLFLIVGGIYGVESLVAKHDASTAQRFESFAQQQNASNQKLQEATQQQISLLASQNVLLQSQITQLSASISARDIALAKQQSKIPTLTVPQLAAEWPKYLTKGTAQATPTGVLLDSLASQETLVQLEELPVRKQDIIDLTAINVKQQTEITNLSTANGSLTTALASEKSAHVADNEANAKQITSLKADCRKSKLKWFAIGVVTGFIGRGLSGI